MSMSPPNGPPFGPMQRLFPENRIVRFNRRQDRLLFFSMVNELVTPDMTVVDFGAGRNRFPDYGRHLDQIATLKGRCERVIGVDVDDAVLSNDAMDEAHVMAPDGAIPLGDETADLIYSYAVFEHLADPAESAAELTRVLKPGGWLCAWTPNKWGYVATAARMVPNAWHGKVLAKAEPKGRGEKDIFPTVYKLNSRSAVRQYFPETAFEHRSFTYNAQPSYHFGSALMARFWLLAMALTPSAMAQGLFVFIQKR